MKEKVLDVRTIHQCNCCFNSPTLHPLISVVRLSNTCIGHSVVRLGFYAVLLVEHEDGKSYCGCTHCDYVDATMIFFHPGQVLNLNSQSEFFSKGWLLVFHPDLLSDTTLSQQIGGYTYFLYNKKEALHLSLREKEQVVECFEAIDKELHHPIDRHSRTLTTRYIELLLDYCTRYYERQFIMREEKNNIIHARLDRFWTEYVREGGLLDGRMPTVDICADLLDLSSQYFIDLLLFRTGMSLSDYFQQKRMEEAKQMLQTGEMDSRSIAHWLGFPNVQLFSLCFKRMTGFSPNAYKLSRS